MRFDSQYCSKIRVSQKQRKTQQMWSGKATPFNRHSILMVEGRHMQLSTIPCASFLGGRSVPSSPTLLLCFKPAQEAPCQPSLFLFATSGPKITSGLFPPIGKLLLPLLGSSGTSLPQRKAFPHQTTSTIPCSLPHPQPSPPTFLLISSDHCLYLKLYRL